MPNKVALRRRDNAELLGLMSYEFDEKGLAVEVIYLESAGHSNANLLHTKGGQKKYIGIAKALFAYAAAVSVEAGFGGVLFFKAKTSELREYYSFQNISKEAYPNMLEQRRSYLQNMEEHGAVHGWVAPLDREGREFLAYFRSACKRYNIVPSKATKLEYDFVTRVAESEFYLQQANG